MENHAHLADHVGRCNREIECGYHFKPKQYFEESGNNNPLSRAHYVHPKTATPSPDFISNGYLQSSMSDALLQGNNFVKYIQSILGYSVAESSIKRFHIGSANRWPGSTVFWQMDSQGLIRSGKIILFNPETGKRVKKPYPHITWVHKQLIRRQIIKTFNLHQCLFGEHQIMRNDHKTIGLVESEKTAIIASAYLPELIWMATGSVNGLKSEFLKAIIGNKIILYPDIKAYERWSKKACELRKVGFNIVTSDLLENSKFITDVERRNGLDLADYLPRTGKPGSS